MTRLVETTVEIRFSAAGEARAVVDSNVAGDLGRQAELVCFAHAAARTVALVGRERGLALVQSLSLVDETLLDDGERRELGRLGIAIVPGMPSGRAAATTRIVARFLSARHEPRMFFSLKTRSSRSSPLADESELAAASLHVAFDALLLGRAVDHSHRRRLVKTAQLVGRFVADGVLREDNEFDVALAAADVAWRSETEPTVDALDVECPVCGNRGETGEAFELRVWPSEHDAIRKCVECGSGLWLREGAEPRRIETPVWEAMEALRESVTADALAQTRRDGGGDGRRPDDETSRVLAELKRVFAESGWPFAEVRDAPVLVSDLSGVWGTWKFYAQVVKEHDAVLFYSICPLRVPEEARLEAAHFLTRANYGLASGNFELDFGDGEIRFKTVLPVDGELKAHAVKRAVRANGIAMETYLPGIGAVITGTAAVPALERRVDV